MKTKNQYSGRSLIVGLGVLVSVVSASAAGLLSPVSSTDQLLDLRSHHVRVVINNGFARTEVEQVFSNPNAYDLEAIYSAPVPESGSLSELTIWAGERVLQGEVVPKAEAGRIYEEEKSQGNKVGKADKNSYQNFEFSVSSVPANGEVRMRYVYYEPLTIDTGVGRYTYPLEEGGTDGGAAAFWTANDIVSTDFSLQVELKSAYPISKTRVPGYGGQVEKTESGNLLYRFESQGAKLDQDFVFYYMLEADLPGRLEMLTYREGSDKPGSFMMVMTPGVDLKPLEGGADFVFALDVSGSMQGKLHTLTSGVKKAIGQLNPADRFRIVAFNNTAFDLNRGWVSVTESHILDTFNRLDKLSSSGGTNVYAGVELAMSRLDADRVSTLILVTDGVTNEGVVDPKAFYRLMQKQDIRFYGFLLGNSSNWPLMQLMCDASGGSYRAVSNSDDIIGEIMIAKNKIAFESLRNAELSIQGVNAYDVGDFKIGKIHFGDQLVLFGRYEKGGTARVTLKARVNGEDKVYTAGVVFPDVDKAHPELERMWAMDQVRKIQVNEMAGFVDASEAALAIRDIGVANQIVTDETSMIALDAEGFARYGVERRNEERVAREAQARQASPNSSGTQRVDAATPMYQQRSHSMGGGGVVEPWFLGVVVLGGVVLYFQKKSKAVSAKRMAVVGFLVLGVGVGGRTEAQDLRGQRWTDRTPSIARSTSSIDESIESFWSVSAEEAQVDVRQSQPPAVYVPMPISSSSKATVVTGYEDARNSHAVSQSRDKGSRRGHLGFNLFNVIPLVDIVWGEDRLDERDSYSGKVRK